MQTQGLGQAQGRMRAYGQQFAAACAAASESTAQQVTGYDKGSHRWQNRTGEAERLIGCRVEVTPTLIRLVNAHGVPYGKWLEVRWQGRYAILLEALRVFMAPWLERCAQQARGLG